MAFPISLTFQFSSIAGLSGHAMWSAARRAFYSDLVAAQNTAYLIIAALFGIAIWAFGISTLAAKVSWIPEPALLWRDSTTTVLNFFAQFLQARKHMENWVFWLIVNLLGIHTYWVKGAPIYSIQYAIFLFLGIYGWLQWRKSSQPQD